MMDGVLVQRKSIEILGESYQIFVYCRSDGKHFAKTYFSEGDVIINDAASLEEVLEKQEHVLPLAVNSRQLLREFHSMPRNARGGR